MIGRNRELRLQLVLSLVTVLGASVLALLWEGRDAAFATFICGALVVAIAMGFTLWRYRRLARLAERVDAVLAGQRNVSLSDMGEGELAVLTSQLSKTLSRLQVANDELDREKRALADSLADISHQLRTPLTSLGLELALMRRDTAMAFDVAALYEVDEEPDDTDRATAEDQRAAGEDRYQAAEGQRERIRDAERLLSRVKWLVESLLKLARLDAGVITLKSERVDVALLVLEAFAPLAVSFDLAGVTFEQEVSPELEYVGDASWTSEALTNILKNCLEHTPKGGTVRLSAWDDALACRIRVSDTGPGIAEVDLPHVFERFYRGEQSKDEDPTNPTGVGIGLSLAQALVTAQGGAIVASNEMAADGSVCGARFDISFYKLVV